MIVPMQNPAMVSSSVASIQRSVASQVSESAIPIRSESTGGARKNAQS